MLTLGHTVEKEKMCQVLEKLGLSLPDEGQVRVNEAIQVVSELLMGANSQYLRVEETGDGYIGMHLPYQAVESFPADLDDAGKIEWFLSQELVPGTPRFNAATRHLQTQGVDTWWSAQVDGRLSVHTNSDSFHSGRSGRSLSAHFGFHPKDSAGTQVLMESVLGDVRRLGGLDRKFVQLWSERGFGYESRRPRLKREAKDVVATLVDPRKKVGDVELAHIDLKMPSAELRSQVIQALGDTW